MIITTINTQDLYFPTLQKKHTHQLLSSQPHTLINHTAHPLPTKVCAAPEHVRVLRSVKAT